MEIAHPLNLPRLRYNAEGRERRVGVEVELSGMGYAKLVDWVADYLGGEARDKAYYEAVVDTPEGEYLIELDSDPIKSLDDDSDLPEPLAQLREGAMDLIEAAAERIVPLEIVTPPLPLSKLDRVEALCDHLARRGALGSRHSLYFAFGCQLNPELPDLDASTILRYLRAFAGLYPWLKERQQLDISRKFTTYISPWPRKYLDRITDPQYNPSLDELINDYIHDNPTRNRALDLMPLWMHLRPEIMAKKMHDPRIKARPTLHYRLPDCDIDNPHWHFSTVWNDWLAVEALASNPAYLDAFNKTFREQQKFSLDNLGRDWVEECDAWVKRALGHASPNS
ncbi:amidoligase family protein [Marinobacteraceae bacterium S3BR75-40.1]